MRKENAPAFGCFDFAAIIMFLWSIFLLFVIPEAIGGALIWIGIVIAFLEFRHGFIRTFLAKQKAQEQQDRMVQQRREAEKIATGNTASASNNVSTNSQGTVSTNQEHQWQAESYFPTYSIAIPKDSSWKPSSAVGLIRGLFERSGRGYIELSIVASSHLIEWQVMFVPESNRYDLTLDEVRDAVQRHYQNASVQLAQIPRFTQTVYRRYRLFAVSQTRYFDQALNVNKIREKTDPLEAVANAMNGLREGETLRFEVTVMGVSTVDEAELERVLTIGARDAGYEYQRGARNYNNLEGMVIGETIGGGLSLLNNWMLGQKKVMLYSEAETEKYMQKLSQPLATTFMSLTFDTPDKSRLQVLNDTAGAILELSGDEIKINNQEAFTANEIKITSFHEAVTRTPYEYLMALAPKTEAEVDQTGKYIFAYTAEELAAVWHLPHQAFEQAGIVRPEPRPDLLIDVREPHLRVGTFNNFGSEEAVAIRLKDLNKHMFIAGKTGTGKSTLLHNMAHQLITQGKGFTLLDPHGKLIDAILSTSIVESVKDRILILELGQDEYPVPLNLFKRVPGVARGEAVSQVLNTIKSVYQTTWSSTLMEKGYRAFLELLLGDSNATPLDIQEMAKTSNVGYLNRMLANALQETERKKKLSRGTRNFWSEYLGKSDSAKNRQTDPIISRLNIFLGKAEIELMTCHPGSIDWKQVVEENMIVLVDLRGQAIASEAESLGALVFAQLYNAVQAMGYQADGAEPRHLVIIDETHRFLTNEVDTAMSEARKFGLPIIMADQWIGQLDESTQRAIRNNVGTRLSFRLDGDEAKKTASLLKPSIDPDDIAKYSVGEAALSTEGSGVSVDAFKLTTYDTPEALIDVMASDAIKAQAHENLARVVKYGDSRFEGRLLSADEVEDWLDERYDQPVFSEALQDDEVLVSQVDLKSKRNSKADDDDQDTEES